MTVTVTLNCNPKTVTLAVTLAVTLTVTLTVTLAVTLTATATVTVTVTLTLPPLQILSLCVCFYPPFPSDLVASSWSFNRNFRTVTVTLKVVPVPKPTMRDSTLHPVPPQNITL